MRVRGFGELEAVIIDRLWNRQQVATVRDIFDELAHDRQLVYTTVLSTMTTCTEKGGWRASGSARRINTGRS